MVSKLRFIWKRTRIRHALYDITLQKIIRVVLLDEAIKQGGYGGEGGGWEAKRHTRACVDDDTGGKRRPVEHHYLRITQINNINA